MLCTVATGWTSPAPSKKPSYLNAGYTLRSWFFTLDHKRICLLYLAAITVFFLVGGLFAALFRIELLTPEGDFLQPDTFNRFFTLHGVVMIFFFLIPFGSRRVGKFLQSPS